jgi:hypothetical protein
VRAFQAFLVLQLLRALQLLRVLQLLQALPSPVLALIDYSQSMKKSQETLKLQITPLISSYAFISFFLKNFAFYIYIKIM